VSAFEEALRDELSWLLRAGVPERVIRIAVRERLAVRLERGALGAREVETPAARLIVAGKLTDGGAVRVDVVGNELRIESVTGARPVEAAA